MPPWLTSWLNRLLDVVYPPTCVHCAQAGVWLCSACRLQVVSFHVPRTAPPLPSGRLPTVEYVWAIASYANPVISALLKTYKYQSAFCLEPVLAELMDAYIAELMVSWPFSEEMNWQLVSMPTEPTHLQRRGMDHAARLAKLWQTVALPHATIIQPLQRRSTEQANAELIDHRHREVNVATIFSAKPVQGKILLIDDVYTSGASSQAAAEALIKAGAERVEILTIAMG